MPIGGVPTQEQIERAQQGGGRTWDDGKYTATGFRFYDDERHVSDGRPIYVPDKNGELRAWVRIIIKGEDDGPPMSLYPGQVLPLAKAFGVDVNKKWPDPMKDSSRFLLDVERAVEKASKEVEIAVSGGWVNEVPGWGLPRDAAFQFVYEDCYSRNKSGDPAWFEGDYGRTTILGFRVVGDLDGEPTPYDGWVERMFVPYRVEPDSNDPTIPAFVQDKGDKTDQDMTRFYGLIMTVCPTLMENDSWEDLENIMPEFDKFAKETRVILHTTTVWSTKAGRVKVYYNTLQPRYKDHRSYEEREAEPTPQERNVEEEELEKAASITFLYDAVAAEVKKTKGETAKAFGPDGKLNKDGQAVAKQYFVPLISSGKVTSNKFAEWSDEEVVVALTAMGYNDLARMVQQNYIEKASPDDVDFE